MSKRNLYGIVVRSNDYSTIKALADILMDASYRELPRGEIKPASVRFARDMLSEWWQAQQLFGPQPAPLDGKNGP